MSLVQDAYFALKRIIPPVPVVRKHLFGTKLRVDLRHHTGYALRGPGVRERQALEDLTRFVSPGDCVFDVGANIGLYTVVLGALVGTGGTVVAIEPDPANCDVLQRNIELNSSPAIVVRAAASSTEGRSSFGVDSLTTQSGRLGGESLVASWSRMARSGESIEVDTVMLDTLASSLDVAPPSFVKIDVEGHEVEVLEGMRGMIERHHPVLLVEVGDGNETAVSKVAADAGYEIREGIENWLMVPKISATPGARRKR